MKQLLAKIFVGLVVLLTFVVVILVITALFNWLDPYLESLMGRFYPLFVIFLMAAILIIWGALTNKQGGPGSPGGDGGDGGGDGGDGGGDGG